MQTRQKKVEFGTLSTEPFVSNNRSKLNYTSYLNFEEFEDSALTHSGTILSLHN